ncbi:MAG: glycosyltransferase [bacterium]
MNACLIAYTFYEFDFRVRRYAEALTKRGDRVDVIVLRRKGEKPHGVLKGVNIFRIQRRSSNEKGVLGYVLGVGLFFVRGTLTLFAMHLRRRYQVIHIHNVPDFLVFMGFIPKLMGARTILDIHDILPEFFCQKFDHGMDTVFAKLLLFIEKTSVHFADHVISANDIWREKIINRDQIPSKTCTTIINYPQQVSMQKSPSDPDKRPFTIIYPGTVSHHHGLDIAIKAISIAKKEIPSLRLDLFARSNNLKYYNSLRDLIKNLDLEQNVRFFPTVPIDRLLVICQRANIGIVPKREGIFASEALSSKILDYMATGLPVIAAKTKIAEYYFPDSMIMFFEPENPQDLARCIIELYKNPEKGQSLSDSGKQFVADNNWEAKKQIYLDLVDSLAKRPYRPTTKFFGSGPQDNR